MSVASKRDGIARWFLLYWSFLRVVYAVLFFLTDEAIWFGIGHTFFLFYLIVHSEDYSLGVLEEHSFRTWENEKEFSIGVSFVEKNAPDTVVVTKI